MKISSIADSLWGNKARLSYLFIASTVLLFTLLGAREIWTQEHRWADIVSGMFYRHDFLHPYLGVNHYYDKPLLSYWLIALVAALTNELTTWALRLPSALAGLLTIWAIYHLGAKLKDKQLGFLSGWLLLTTFYFVFWARTSSADMLNLAGSLFAVSWYFDRRENTRFFDYAIFFMILALTSLCKGLVGVIVPLIAVFIDIVLQKSWKRHLHGLLFLAAIPGLIIYLSPFLASSLIGAESYGQSGLYMVFRENIIRYVKPFDHQGSIYIYFIFLPIYLLPWAVFFIPALFALALRWKRMSINSKWITWTLLSLFLFFTLSGSRRSYYVLPMVPFAILFTADWILSAGVQSLRRLWAAGIVVLSFILLFLSFDVLQPWYYSQYGVNRFATILKADAGHIKPWNEWNVIMLDAESKLNFYLQLPPNIRHYGITGIRGIQTAASLLAAWPILADKPTDTIFITRKLYEPLLRQYFTNYRIVEMHSLANFPFLKTHDENAPIAFIPTKLKN